MVNVELMQKVLDHISAHPEEWDQKNWAKKRTESDWLVQQGLKSCGTAYCFAGHAVVMAGYEIEWHSGEGHVHRLTNGREIEHVAAEELGLSEVDAGELFAPLNSLKGLYMRASTFTDGAITVPESLAHQSEFVSHVESNW